MKASWVYLFDKVGPATYTLMLSKIKSDGVYIYYPCSINAGRGSRHVERVGKSYINKLTRLKIRGGPVAPYKYTIDSGDRHLQTMPVYGYRQVS